MVQIQPLLFCLTRIPMALLSFGLTLLILQHRDYTNTGGLCSLFETLGIWVLLCNTLMLAVQLFLHSHFLFTTLEHLKEALEAVEDEHKLEKYPGLVGQYPSSALSNDSFSYQASTPPSLFSVPDAHLIESQFVISYAADRVDVLKTSFNPIKDASARHIPSYLLKLISKKATSTETMERLNAPAVSKASVPDILSSNNPGILAALATEEGVHWEDRISSWNLNVVNARPKGMWLANEHSYDRHFGKEGSWEGYGYHSNDEGYDSLGEWKKGRKVLRKMNLDEGVKGDGRTASRVVVVHRQGRRGGLAASLRRVILFY